MSKKPGKVIVCGDICIDLYQWQTPKKERGHNWQLQDGSAFCARAGGALLTAEMLRALVSGEPSDLEVIAPTLSHNGTAFSGDTLHSNIRLAACPATAGDKGKKTYRVIDNFGYTGPAEGSPPPKPFDASIEGADFVVIDDSGNGFRDSADGRPNGLGAKSGPWIIYKMHRPLFEGPLWKDVTGQHASTLVPIISADDLRASGIPIGRSLSWERTLLETVRECRDPSNALHAAIRSCYCMVIRFGVEGALLCWAVAEKMDFRLIFTPGFLENGFSASYPGTMFGLACAFTAGFTRELATVGAPERGVNALARAAEKGLHCSQALLINGFSPEHDAPSFDLKACLNAQRKPLPLGDITLPAGLVIRKEELHTWNILENIASVNADGIENVALNVLVKGDAAALPNVPIGRFGNLLTVDRNEIESFQGVKSLLSAYVTTRQTKPVSIAVFGAPGSGKSFGVKEIAKIVAGDQIVELEFNISQFQNLADLTAAFQSVRDTVLMGKIPLVFFDEFDSALGQSKYGWLRYFLAPMQDGKFKDGEAMHPIGKAIFVFAGGIFSSFQKFNEESIGKDAGTFREAKGPDFISRLKGYVNIIGPNQQNSKDVMYIIRRATLLRNMLGRFHKSLFAQNGDLQIDNNLARALLLLPRYKHGARSMEAIIDTSRLHDRPGWQKAFLPTREQLEIHVEVTPFMEYVLGTATLGYIRELIATEIHAKYCESELKNPDGKKQDAPEMQPWDLLADTYKQSNRRQADDFPEKLRQLGLKMHLVIGRPVYNKPLNETNVEKMAEQEHERWMKERTDDGWVFGEKRNNFLKRHPLLVDWSKLSKADKDKDRDPIQNIPEILQNCNIVIEELLP